MYIYVGGHGFNNGHDDYLFPIDFQENYHENNHEIDSFLSYNLRKCSLAKLIENFAQLVLINENDNKKEINLICFWDACRVRAKNEFSSQSFLKKLDNLKFSIVFGCNIDNSAFEVECDDEKYRGSIVLNAFLDCLNDSLNINRLSDVLNKMEKYIDDLKIKLKQHALLDIKRFQNLDGTNSPGKQLFIENRIIFIKEMDRVQGLFTYNKVTCEPINVSAKARCNSNFMKSNNLTDKKLQGSRFYGKVPISDNNEGNILLHFSFEIDEFLNSLVLSVKKSKPNLLFNVRCLPEQIKITQIESNEFINKYRLTRLHMLNNQDLTLEFQQINSYDISRIGFSCNKLPFTLPVSKLYTDIIDEYLNKPEWLDNDFPQTISVQESEIESSLNSSMSSINN